MSDGESSQKDARLWVKHKGSLRCRCSSACASLRSAQPLMLVKDVGGVCVCVRVCVCVWNVCVWNVCVSCVLAEDTHTHDWAKGETAESTRTIWRPSQVGYITREALLNPPPPPPRYLHHIYKDISCRHEGQPISPGQVCKHQLWKSGTCSSCMWMPRYDVLHGHSDSPHMTHALIYYS